MRVVVLPSRLQIPAASVVCKPPAYSVLQSPTAYTYLRPTLSAMAWSLPDTTPRNFNVRQDHKKPRPLRSMVSLQTLSTIRSLVMSILYPWPDIALTPSSLLFKP
jgi:hypothetical protein